MADTGVVVKNTFLEVGDHKSLLERSDGWRRQMSEPVKIYTDSGHGLQDAASLSESDDELLLGNSMPAAQMDPRSNKAPLQSTLNSQAVGSSMPVPETETLPPPAGAQAPPSKPPKVLLLSESIPPSKRGVQKEREKKGARDGHINQMKDNSITKKEPPWTGVTTVMMRNLPNKYTQQMLLEELQDGGFRVLHDFDFFYLPMDHSNAANLGYCFINFVETALANAFAAAFQGKKMRRFNSNKTVVVMPASVQGYERNYAYYASTRVVQAEDPQYRPLFLRPPSEGCQAPLVSTVNHRATARGRGGGGKAGSSSSSTGTYKELRKGERGGGKGGMQRNADLMAQSADMNMMSGVHDWMATTGVGCPWPEMQGPPPPQQQPQQPQPQQLQPQPQPQPQQPQLQAQQQQHHCPACGALCAPTHRFCAFCGADQQALLGSIPSLRADAPAFTPTVSGGFGPLPGQVPGQVQAAAAPEASGLHVPAVLQGQAQTQAPGQVQAQAQASGLQAGGEPWQALSGALRSPEVITDELDVMRGRMVLLAALIDMEERESMGADPRRNTSLPLQMPGQLPAAANPLGGCADFFSAL